MIAKSSIHRYDIVFRLRPSAVRYERSTELTPTAHVEGSRAG
jgi:hypothetical protein